MATDATLTANDPSAKGLPSGRCSVRLRETAMYVAAATPFLAPKDTTISSLRRINNF